MTTLHRVATGCAVAALTIGMALGTPSLAQAQSQPDLADMMAAMKRLEARVTALEGENRQAKQDAATARAEARALRQKMEVAAPAVRTAGSAPSGGTPAPKVATLPPGTFAMATKAPLLAPAPSWSGLYAGAAFGLGWRRSQATEGITERSGNTVTVPGLFSDSSSSTQTSIASIGGSDPSAAVNLLLGYNFMATENVILGGQVEGGVSNGRVTLHGSGVGTTNNDSNAINLNAFTETAFLQDRWMGSVLGRGGVLIDPVDFVYGLGGYTYGRFEALNAGFGLNGATIGAGWERQLAPGWTLRGEYRYTKFQDKDLVHVAAGSSSSTAFDASGAITVMSTGQQVTTTTDHVSADMHSAWLGVAHYFDH